MCPIATTSNEPTPHVPILIGNTRIFFPFEPYETQKQYAHFVIKALTLKQNAILESPTGTGKTLSLLCSTLGWLQSQGNIRTTVYYTSRTHTQLAQAARELKKTAYSRNPSIVIGSRSQMCLNDDVRSLGDGLINRACRNAIAKNACSYHFNYEQKLECLDTDSVNDIEDMIDFGRKNQVCPYYASKKVAESKATVIFMPYNYLVDTSIRKSLQLKLENSIIIFDEAHNIESTLKDAVSASFRNTCLRTIQDSCLKLPEKISDALNQEKHGLSRTGFVEAPDKPNSKKDKEPRVNPIEELAAKLTNNKLQQVNESAKNLETEVLQNLTLNNMAPVENVLYMMKNCGIVYATSTDILTTLDSMASFWSMAGVMNPSMVARHVTAITNLHGFISQLFPDDCLSVKRQSDHVKLLNKSYVTYLKPEPEPSTVRRDSVSNDWELHLWCLNPAIGMKQAIDSNCINGPRSILVTSGTLTPLYSVERELDRKFDIKQEFKHVISEKQLKIMIIGESPDNYSLQSNYEQLKKDEYSLALGKTLRMLLQILPYGTLIFFPSYSAMNRVFKYWKEKSTIWKDIGKTTNVFFEVAKNLDISNYKKCIDQERRAVYFGVCRGKLSEGVNLQDNYCRTVILTGLPFPSITDPKVKATKNFHDKMQMSSGELWYTQQMTRALNQTVGRVIRGCQDFGMILLCDPRFTRSKFSLSEWTRPFFPTKHTSVSEAELEIKNFFSQNGINIQEAIAEHAGAFEIGLSRPISNRSVNSYQISSPRVRERPHTPQGFIVSPPTPVQTAQQRQEDMVRQYRVDRQTFERVQSQRNQSQQQESAPDCPVQAKRIRSHSEVFDQATTSNQAAQSQPRPIKSLNIFKKKNSKASGVSSNPEVLTIRSSHDYSILDDYKKKRGRLTTYACYICSNKAEQPMLTNCKCLKVGCDRCVRVLNKKTCGKCGVKYKIKCFRPLIFKSTFIKRHRFTE